MTDGRDRRSVLRAGAALCSVGLAGCTNGGGGDDGGSSNGTNGSDGTDDPEPPEPEPVTSWPMQQYDAGNTAAVSNAEVPEDIEELWRLELDEQVRSSPVVAEGVLFVRDGGGTVHAIDADGSKQWTASVPEGELETTPAIYEDFLLVPHDSGIVAFDRTDGTEQWQYTSERGTTDLTVADDAVFFADTQGGVFALEAGTGDLRWDYLLNPALGRYTHAPAVTDQTVYIPMTAGGQADSWGISSFDVETGEKDSFFESETYGFSAGLSIADERIFAPTPGGIHAYDLQGTELWHFPMEKPLRSGLAVAGDLVYGISSEDFTGTLYAIDAKDGSERWSVGAQTTRGHGPLVVGDELVYANSLERILSYDPATGDELWSLDTPLTIFIWGAFANEQFYFVDADGITLAYGEPDV